MTEIAVFLIASIGLAYISRSSLVHPASHGFYRFFAWECILVLFVLNARHWFADPFSIRQIFSWLLLLASLLLVVPGIGMLHRKGKADNRRREEPLMAFEKTTVLVTDGIYHYVRHPLYSSLLFLDWGIVFKGPSPASIILGLATTLLLILTARAEEREDIAFFGEAYREYMRRTKMFVPYLL